MSEPKKKRRYMEVWQEKCPVCGKVFTPAPQHVYKVGGELVCSWTCKLRGDEAEEAGTLKIPAALTVRASNKYSMEVKADAVIRVLKDQEKPAKVAEDVGCAPSTLWKWVNLYNEGAFEKYFKECRKK